MQVVTVTLERLFDVKRNTFAGDSPHVYFSCVADGQRHFSVRLPGNPRLEVGDRITLVLGEPGNWQSIKGWKNHADGEVLLPGRASLIGLPALGFMFVMVAQAWRDATTSSNRVILGAFAVLLTWLLLLLAHQVWESIRVARLLKAA